MSNINLGLSMHQLDIGDKILTFSGVILHAGRDDGGNDRTYSAGNSSGYVLEIDNSLGTQEIANAIFSELKQRCVKYQPFTADTAHLNPAAEIGDGVTADEKESVILAQNIVFDRMMTSTVSAPFDEEVDHEYNYVPRTEREFRRESSYTRSRLSITQDAITAEVIRATDSEEYLQSQLNITATEISAKVSKTGGNPASFGWTLTDSSWTLKSNNTTVLSVTSSGLSVSGSGTFSGTITATAGVIGGVTIQNGVLSGITSTNIEAGGIDGGEGGSLSSGSLTNWNMTGGINANLGYGAAYGLAIQQGTNEYPNVFNCNNLVNKGRFMSIGGSVCQLYTKTIDGVTFTYIGNQ